MANYKQPQTVTRRVRFFDGQFLQDQDFVDEQNYHLDRQQRALRSFLVSGIVHGLEVKSSAPWKISISAGMAIDSAGRQLLVGEERAVNIDQTQGGMSLIVYLSYHQEAVDRQNPAKGQAGETRWIEEPAITVLEESKAYKPDANWKSYTELKPDALSLAQLTVGNDGTISIQDPATVRVYSGLRLAGPNGLDASPVLQVDQTGAIGFWVNSRKDEPQLAIGENGNVGVGSPPSSARLKVDGATSLKGTLSVSGDATLNGNVSVGSSPSAARLTVNGETILQGKLTVSEDTDLKKALSVGGNATFSGNVGLGSSPSDDIRLVVSGATHLDGSLNINGSGDNILTITDATKNNRLIVGTDSNMQGFLRLRPTSGEGIAITNNGDSIGVFVHKDGHHVSIGGKGILSKARLSVHGDIRLTGTILTASSDYAEDFDIHQDKTVVPGTVMVIADDGRLRQADRAYDRRVAGVLSGAGEYTPGIVLGRVESENDRLPLALSGKVCCKVDAAYASIAIGDLLTTSATPGHAMKASNPTKAFGAVIGKALSSLSEGQGLIPILVALQ